MKSSKWLFGVCVVIVIGWCLADRTSAQSKVEVAAKAVRWEYLTEAVDVNSLSARLSEWGQQNWEVFSIAELDRALEQTDKTRIKIEKFQVTSRRPLK